jgi:transcriptional regulator with XRE-family HTH domain
MTLVALTDDELMLRQGQAGPLNERECFFILRRRAGIAQTRVAELAGSTQSYLSAWESGRWNPPLKKALSYWAALDKLLAEYNLDQATPELVE